MTGLELSEQERTRFAHPPLISVICDGAMDLSAQSYRGFSLLRRAEAGSAQGDFLLFVPEGSVLSRDALYRFAFEIALGADFIYCDEDRVENGVRKEPRFKPDYSPETLMFVNYIGDCFAVSKRLFQSCGGVADEAHSLVLRLCGAAAKVAHIPRVLLTRGAVRESERRSFIPPAAFKSVSVIVISDRGRDELSRTLRGLESGSVYSNYSFYIADAAPHDSRLEKLYSALEKNGAARIIGGGESCNRAALLNRCAADAEGEYLLFLNAASYPVREDFLEQLMGILALDGVGAAGSMLINRDGTLHSCGTVVGLFGGLFSLYSGFAPRKNDPLYRNFAGTIRNVTVLPIDGLMTSRELFLQLCGFDETLQVAGFSEDYCLRLMAMGKRAVYNPNAELCVLQPLPVAIDAKNDMRLMDVFRPLLVSTDPFYNPNYDYNCGVPEVASAPVSPLILHSRNGKWV